MTLEQQVCSLDLAKSLKDLGVKQDSHCYWVQDSATDQAPELIAFMNGLGREPVLDYIAETNHLLQTSAFTVAELGEMLPVLGGATPLIQKLPEKWTVAYIADNDGHIIRAHDALFQDETEADARAKMLIYLIEKGLVEATKGIQDAKAA